MQTWAILLIYSLVVVLYAALQQLFFRFKFRDLGFTLGFITLIGMVLMFATKFHDVFTWITVVNLIVDALFSVYVGVLLRKARDKIRQQLQSGGLEDMLKSIIMGGAAAGAEPDVFEDDRPEIVVTEEKNQTPPEEDRDFEVGDIIVEENKDEGEKRDDQEEK